MKARAAAVLIGLVAAPALAASPGGGGVGAHMPAAGASGVPHPLGPAPVLPFRSPASGQVQPVPARPPDRAVGGIGQQPARLLTPSDPVLARLSPIYETCMHRAISPLDMLDCGGRETERWDGRLNRAYQARMASLGDRQRGALKRAQKAWMVFREADCAAYEDEDGGAVSRIDAAQCQLRRTVERTLELEAFPADHGPG